MNACASRSRNGRCSRRQRSAAGRRRGEFAGRWTARLLGALAVLWAVAAGAEQLVEIPTRPGVTQRMLVLPAARPLATVILLPGGHGGLQLGPDGALRWGAGNFLVRSRQAFADQGFTVVLVDAPSDRQQPPFLAGFRQRPEHVADLGAVIAWARSSAPAPVWLVGTSRGTQSAAYLATALSGPAGPDGVVLTATVLLDPRGRAVPAMPLQRVHVPVLVLHHTQDGCAACPFALAGQVVAGLTNAPRRELAAVSGGTSQGDPCEAFAHHGFHGIEGAVVQRIADWILAR